MQSGNNSEYVANLSTGGRSFCNEEWDTLSDTSKWTVKGNSGFLTVHYRKRESEHNPSRQ